MSESILTIELTDPGRCWRQIHPDSAATRGDQVSWSAILLEEICEAYNAPDRGHLREELIQCAAVIGQWVEAIDRSRIKDGITWLTT